MSASSRPFLSVVVLCYRAGDSARARVRELEEALRTGGIEDFQLVLVGNYIEGSDDPTPAVVRDLAAADPRVVCTAVAKRGWMGWDLRTGLALAGGEVIGFLDGDGQNLAGDVPRLHHLLLEEGLDLVKTVRRRRGDGWRRRWLSIFYNALFRLLFPRVAARDINAKPKLMTRAAYERLELAADDWFIDAEIMIQAARLGLRVGELETDFLPLEGRASFVGPRAMAEFLANLFRYRLRELRRRVDRPALPPRR